MASSIARVAGLAAAIGLAGTAAFQLLLALGVPWGRAAWGGAHNRLPAALRVASALSAGILLIAAFVVLGRAGSRRLLIRVASSVTVKPYRYAPDRFQQEGWRPAGSG
jgi:hypothetical protein